MSEFKVGDRVRRIGKDNHGTHGFKDNHGTHGFVVQTGETYTIKSIGSQGWLNLKESPPSWGHENNPDYFIKIEGTMKYDELKSRIEALENGWDKEADDIIQEMKLSEGSYNYWISIATNNTSMFATIEINRSTCCGEVVAQLPFKSQCEKMSAFKQALMWLLDHSDIKKDEKQDKIKELESELYKMNEKYDSIKEEIRKLK